MTETTLIQCTNSKRDSTAPARKLYDESNLFRLMRDYADARGNDWYILSAKHGLVNPDTQLDPYDEVGLSESQCETIAAEIADSGYDTVRVVAGRKYTADLIPALERRGIDVIEVCAGLKIGDRMSKLKDLIVAEQHQELC